MTRPPSPHTLRRLAAQAIRNRNRGMAQPVPAKDQHFTQASADAAHATAALAVQIGDLPFLARRVLRIIADHQAIDSHALHKEADLDLGPREQTDLLILYGLVARSAGGRHYSITPAGASCVAKEAQRSSAPTHPTTGDAHHG